MKIALFNCFPNLSHSAEKEFISRSIIALGRLGHEAFHVRTSDEINSVDPDVVIITHEFVAKTTDHFTVGLLWSPLEHYSKEYDRIKAIRSWDLIIPINENVRAFARSIHSSARADEAVSNLAFFPSTQIFDIGAPKADHIDLAYIGAHWDGNRHQQLFESLAPVTDLNVYGPADKWQFIPDCYRGDVPFDGESVLRTLNRHGAVLAVHKSTHRLADTPSMRVFESCAAKCLIFTEPMESIKSLFGNTLEYIDVAAEPAEIARHISERIKHYKSNPKELYEKIAASHEIFSKSASLEVLYRDLCAEVDEKKHKRRQSLRAVQSGSVSIIIRYGSRPLNYLQRAIQSLKQQTYANIGVVISNFGDASTLDTFVSDLRQEGRFTFVSVISTTPNGMRSTPLWAAFQEVKTDYFGVLDDDDELYSTHIADLVRELDAHPVNDVAYSGVIKCQEDGVDCNQHARFNGPKNSGVVERRTLHFFDEFDLERMLRWDNFIQSNTWLARSRLLEQDLLREDPNLSVMEDVYFYFVASRTAPFVFSGRATAVWNWRKSSHQNSMTAVPPVEWRKNGGKIMRLLANERFSNGYLGHELFGRGTPTHRENLSRKIGLWIWRIKQAVRIEMSGLFDRSFYRNNNPDIGIEWAAFHYVRIGASQHRDPSPSFSTAFYTATYPDVDYSGLNPLLHYALHGIGKRAISESNPPPSVIDTQIEESTGTTERETTS
jgi:glycosyltransferase involved in cell wall biosynthesis